MRLLHKNLHIKKIKYFIIDNKIKILQYNHEENKNGLCSTPRA